MIDIFKADEKQIDLIVKLVNKAYRGDEAKKGWTTEADFLEGQRINADLLLDILNDPKSIILVASKRSENKIIGCVNLRNEGLKCYLGMLTVDPTIQNQGLGKLFLYRAEEQAKIWNCQIIFMTVISIRKELISWYERHGFHLTSARKPFPYGNPNFGLPKLNNLEFVFLEKKINGRAL